MSNVRIFPRLEKWDIDDEYLYTYGDAIPNEDGSYEMEIFKIPLSEAPREAFYRSKQVPKEMLDMPQYSNCKYCDKPLTNGYWRRMHKCKKCHDEKRGSQKLFYPNCKICDTPLTANDCHKSCLCSKCYDEKLQNEEEIDYRLRRF